MTDPITKAHAAVDYVHSEHRRQIREKNRQINALQAEKGELQRALQERPRPLVPDAITDEMVLNALVAYHDIAGRQARTVDWTWSQINSMDRAIRAALTEPPKRPEGAEEIEVLLRDYGINDGEQDFANWLAKRGVRVTGSES